MKCFPQCAIRLSLDSAAMETKNDRKSYRAAALSETGATVKMLTPQTESSNGVQTTIFSDVKY